MDSVVLTDPVAYSRQLVHMLSKAEKEVYYSSFVASLDIVLPGCDVTLFELLDRLGQRGVALNMLVNPELSYGNLSVEELAQRLPHATIKPVYGSGTLPLAAALVVTNTRYSNHHQKYVCVDGHTFMLGGTDVSVERSPWLVPNKDGYVWHEVAVVMRCTPAMHRFCALNFQQIVDNPPFPLTKGYSEYMVVLRLIASARSTVHMEAQTCISTGNTENGVLRAVVHRVLQAVTEGKPFYFMLLTNLEQRDEARVVSWVAQHQLYASLKHMVAEAERVGLSEAVLWEHVVVASLEHEGVHVKVHSNLLIVDGQRMLRSSSNFTDRSWSSKPSDNELGVVLSGEVVAATQQRLWRQYFMVPPHVRTLFMPQQAFHYMCHNTGLIRRVVQWPSSVLTDAVVKAVDGPWFGGKKAVSWTVN
jgi:phosphatidylserine/phosphatidylglycerophosphate/cardiolipin synthase-like enzyme